MKKILFLGMTVLMTMFFTGCGVTAIQYQKYDIERNLNKNVNKIEEMSVKITDHSEAKMTRKLNNLSISAVTYEVDAAMINKEVGTEFFKQYFVEVDKNPVFEVDSKIVNYLIVNNLNPNNQDVTIEMNFIVKRNGKVILDKTYKEEAPGHSIWEFRATPLEITKKKFQKGVLHIYETKLKPDLLSALKKSN